MNIRCGLCGTAIRRLSPREWVSWDKNDKAADEPVWHEHAPHGPWIQSENMRSSQPALVPEPSSRKWGGDRSAFDFVETVVADFEAGGIGDGSYSYDDDERSLERFMLAGNGPTAWAYFVFTDDGDLDHAYVEFSDSDGFALAPIPPHKANGVLQALRQDTVRRRRRGA